MADQRMFKRGGMYWDNGKPYLSVTDILSSIDKPALRYWFGQEVYRAFLLDPTMNEKTALSAPYKASDRAKSRGSTIHSIVEAYKHTGEIEVMPEIKGYVDAFYDFMRTIKPEIKEQEKTVFDHEHRIAGTLDMQATINGKDWLIDVKTGKDIYQESGLQLSAYAHMTGVENIAVLLLETGADKQPTGKYKFQTMTNDFDTFLAVKKVYCYLNRERLLKIGYEL